MPSGIYVRIKPTKKFGKFKKCPICNKDFWVFPCLFKIRKHCSIKCNAKAKKGIKGRIPSEETRRKMSIVFKGRPKSPKAYTFPKGKKHYNWKGGKFISSSGYILIYKPNHPFCYQGKYVKQAKLIMEKHLGRYITKDEIIHHINGIKTDDRLKNLELFPNNSKHARFHMLSCNRF